MCPPGVAGETGFAGRGGVTRGRSPGSYPSGASGIAPVPVRSGQGASVLVDDELDEAAAVEVDDGHTGQSRCALTRSATGPLARTRTAPCATGRSARRGLLRTPCWTSRSSSGAVSTGSGRATGVPRSVTTTSSPARARSIQQDSYARKVLSPRPYT